jgi:hypothetical protein
MSDEEVLKAFANSLKRDFKINGSVTGPYDVKVIGLDKVSSGQAFKLVDDERGVFYVTISI